MPGMTVLAGVRGMAGLPMMPGVKDLLYPVEDYIIYLNI